MLTFHLGTTSFSTLYKEQNMFKDYDIAMAGSVHDLVKKVREKLEEGWQPFQSITVTQESYGKEYIQALVKTGECKHD